MGGASSSDQSARNVRPRTCHSERRYHQEQHEGAEFSPQYGDYRAPFQTHDSDHMSYPAAPHASAPPQGFCPRAYSPRSSGYSRAQPLSPSSSRAARPRPKLERKYSKIADNYNSLEEITDALAQAGLESSNLIVGIDFTKSNDWTGKHSFNGRSLHYISDSTPNPYEQAISIIGQTLSAFDEDNLIPCFGFGDASTHDQDVFSFYPDEKPCSGFPRALARYREIVPHLRLAGPTSFAPMIEMAMTIVEKSGGQYHVLIIITDGQVTRSVDTEFGQSSSQERKTVDAIVKASEFPLSIILVGVGDGLWDMMQEFDDNIPARSFDNFQFVDFTAIMSKNVSQTRKEMEFAVTALMEVPSQYKATLELGILGRRDTKSPERVPLPPPFGTYNVASTAPNSFSSSIGLRQIAPSHSSDSASTSTFTSLPAAAPSNSQDGPWGMMQEFYDNIPARSFDNFQFVDFTAIMSKNVSQTRKETEFAVAAIKEVPSQYKATLELGIFGWRDKKSPKRVPLPPPSGTYNIASTAPKPFATSSGLQQRAPSHSSDRVSTSTSTSPPAATPSDSQVCPVCLSYSRDMAFGCRHQTCSNCGLNLESCPI